MQKTNNKNQPPKTKIIKIIVVLVIGFLAMILIVIAVLFLWPLKSVSLQTATPHTYTYDEAMDAIQNIKTKETAAGVTEKCQTQVYTHGKQTDKSVVMFHGIGECPDQMSGLAKQFYDNGYNVLVMRTPEHGMQNNKLHGRVTAEKATTVASMAADLGAGLGKNVGAIGISGGAVMATWLAEYRPDVVSKLLVISPFYSPSTKMVPKWQQRFLSVLYANGILPDSFSKPADGELSYHALGQFMRLSANLKSQPYNSNLDSVVSITSPTDSAIDIDRAKSETELIANTNNTKLIVYQTPSQWQLGHDIVGGNPKNLDIKGHSAELYPIYFDLYNN